MKLLLDYRTNDIYDLSGVSSLVPPLDSSGGAAILRGTCQSINSFLHPRFSFPHEKPMTDSARSAFKSTAEKAGSVSFPLHTANIFAFLLTRRHVIIDIITVKKIFDMPTSNCYEQVSYFFINLFRKLKRKKLQSCISGFDRFEEGTEFAENEIQWDKTRTLLWCHAHFFFINK